MRPMLAARAESEADIKYPCLATPKIDGIRCLKVADEFVSRSFKQIRNPHVRDLFGWLPDGVDGELIVPGGTFQDTTSSVMSYDGPKNLHYLLFDMDVSAMGYSERVATLISGLRSRDGANDAVKVLIPRLISSADELLRFEQDCLKDGWEGVVTRSPKSPYKYGRSTLREQYMVKLKRWSDGEAVILSVGEAVQNTNEVEMDNFGYARRPGSAANCIPKGTMGYLEVKDLATGIEFSVGTGFDQAMRDRVWAQRATMVGKIIRYKYQAVGAKDRPRFPSFDGFRED